MFYSKLSLFRTLFDTVKAKKVVERKFCTYNGGTYAITLILRITLVFCKKKTRQNNISSVLIKLYWQDWYYRVSLLRVIVEIDG